MDTFSVTDLRHKTNNVLSAAKQYGYVPVLKNSQYDAIIVDPKYFSALQDALQDYLDILEYDKGMESLKLEPTIPFDQI